MILVHGQDAAVGQWVAQRIPNIETVDNLGPFVAVGVIHKDALIAGCVYHNYIPRYQHCEISFAADTPKFATKKVITTLLGIPFEKYGCRTISLTVPHDKERTRKFVSGIDFKRRGCMPEFFAPGVHAELYSMTQKDYAKLCRRFGHG